MAISGIETIVSICWESLCAAHLELLCAFVFLGGWYYGKIGQKQQKIKLSKGGFKQHQNGKPGKRSPKAADRKPQAFAPLESIENVNPALLQDAAWVISQVTHLCNSQVPEALLLYRSAVKAGLEAGQLAADDCRQLFTALVTATIRAGKVDETIKLFSDLRQCSVGVSSGLFASAVKLCTSKQLFEESLAMFDFMSNDPTFAIKDKSIWSCLLFCATEAKQFQRCPEFFEHVKACGLPSSKDFGNMLRIAALSADWEKSLSIIKDMVAAGVDIDSFQCNTTLATCVAAGKVDEASALLDMMGSEAGTVDVITYNTIMKGYAKEGRINECFKLLECMRSKGISSSQVTYGILLDCCINENQLDRAMKIVNDMTAEGCEMNTVLYTTLIKGLARAGDFEKAMKMYKLMRSDRGISPDLITFSILIKANCDNDNLEEALKLLEEMISLGLKPDEVVFNNLIAGCGRHGNVSLGKHLYEDMVKSGVRPSNATFSILIRLYHQGKALDEAVTLLSVEPAKQRVEPEPRLFVQLIQACVRERQGKRAIEVYGMLAERSRLTGTTHSSILSTCMKLNMYDTAAEIVSIAAANGACVDACDTKLVLEAAFKKNKSQVVRSMIASMKTLGHAVDDKFVQSVNVDTLPANLAMRRGCGDSVRVSGAMKRVAAAC